MTIIRRTNPLGELVSLRQAMDRLFDDSFVRSRLGPASEDNQLALDIRQTSDAIVVEAALPGIKPEDVDITVLGDTLTISASHREEQNRAEEGYSYREIAEIVGCPVDTVKTRMFHARRRLRVLLSDCRENAA